MRIKQSHGASSISAGQASKRLAELMDRVANAKDRVILTRRKKPLAALVPLEDVELLEELEDRADLEAAKAAREEVKREGSIPLDRVLAEFGIKR